MYNRENVKNTYLVIMLLSVLWGGFSLFILGQHINIDWLPYIALGPLILFIPIGIVVITILTPFWKRSFAKKFVLVEEIADALPEKTPKYCSKCGAPMVVDRELQPVAFDEETREPIMGRYVGCSAWLENKTSDSHNPIPLREDQLGQPNPDVSLEDIFEMDADGEVKMVRTS